MCCTADSVSSGCVSTEITYTWFRWKSGSDQEVAALGNDVILSAPFSGVVVCHQGCFSLTHKVSGSFRAHLVTVEKLFIDNTL